MTEASPDTPLTVHYNGACPVCRATASHYSGKLPEEMVRFADAAAKPEAAEAFGLSRDTAMRRLHAITPDGRLYRGFEAVLALWRRTPGRRGLARLAGAPVIRPALSWGYEHILSRGLYHWSKRRLAARKDPA